MLYTTVSRGRLKVVNTIPPTTHTHARTYARTHARTHTHIHTHAHSVIEVTLLVYSKSEQNIKVDSKIVAFSIRSNLISSYKHMLFIFNMFTKRALINT